MHHSELNSVCGVLGCACSFEFSCSQCISNVLEFVKFQNLSNLLLGHLCQANTTDELPERLIGAVRVSHIELKSAIVPRLEQDPE